MYQLSQDPVFQNRVQAALLAACVAIANEGWAVAFHRERSIYVASILSSTTNLTAAVTLFASSVATDTNCIADATQAGTVSLTVGNRAAQAALVTDTHLSAAVSSQFNSFVREPA